MPDEGTPPTPAPAPAQTPPPSPPSWPVLTLYERRVLGVLAEKQKTTPDSYPLSINAVVTGCNQKSNRDPILDLNDLDVEDALASVQKKGLAVRLTGGRVEKWRHNLYDAWKVDKAEMAILIELLVRDPQTEGELRTRASRMEPFDDLDALRKVLKPMAARGLVVYLSPEGRRGTTLTHGFHSPQELQRLKASQPAEPAPAPAPAATPAPPPVAAPPEPALDETLSAMQAELATARQDIDRLRANLMELQTLTKALEEQVRRLTESLGG